MNPLARLPRLCTMRAEGSGVFMKHYRVNKVTKPNGTILKRKDVLANDDKQALRTAAEDEDCPTCEVFHAGEKIGSIL